MNIAIDTNIPLPDKKQLIQVQYPFLEMDIGHSFQLFAAEGVDASVLEKRVRNHAARLRQLGILPKEYRIDVRVSDNGIRVWRTEDGKAITRTKKQSDEQVG